MSKASMRPALEALEEKACASIRYRVRRDILGESPDVSDYIDGILSDRRVRCVLDWQHEDGFFGEVFHGGWIPQEKRKFSATGAESCLRFLAEMGLPRTFPAIRRGLSVLLGDNWNRGASAWNTYAPEIGLWGDDYLRATIFSYYGAEDEDFVEAEALRALAVLESAARIEDFGAITETYRGKRYYIKGAALPEIYHLRLLAFTTRWRTNEAIDAAARAVEHLIALSPLPIVYVKRRSQLISPARIYPGDLGKSPGDFGGKDWFPWLHTTELFARMGIVRRAPSLRHQVEELKGLLDAGGVPMITKPDERGFRKWSVYTGLALEEDWKGAKWKYDLAFRSLLILKNAGML